jgi:hypothetical protein
VLEEVAGAGDFASGGAEWCDGEHGVGWGGCGDGVTDWPSCTCREWSRR